LENFQRQQQQQQQQQQEQGVGSGQSQQTEQEAQLEAQLQTEVEKATVRAVEELAAYDAIASLSHNHSKEKHGATATVERAGAREPPPVPKGEALPSVHACCLKCHSMNDCATTWVLDVHACAHAIE